MTTPIDIATLRGWIGREETIADVLTADLAGKFAATLALPRDKIAEGAPAPRLIHFCLAQPALPAALLGPDGHPARGGFLPPVPLPRRMWAGGELRFHGDLKVGDQVRRVSRIADVALKEGRTGPLCFVTVEHRIEARGQVMVEERQDLVYREALPAATTSPPPAPIGEVSRRFDTTPTTLFRYSALTFNGHRIHYDRRYAMEQEGYGGLVVHGPLQATVLMLLAAEIAGRSPDRFAFRGQSPLFDDDICLMHAVSEGGSVRLWTAREGGPVAMSAEASWVS
jgi:3-methylfumaryl-CoA hydratase